MKAFIDEHRDVEPICRVLPISTYLRVRGGSSRRAAAGDQAKDNFRRSQGLALRREGTARCTVARLMAQMGLKRGGGKRCKPRSATRPCRAIMNRRGAAAQPSRVSLHLCPTWAGFLCGA